MEDDDHQFNDLHHYHDHKALAGLANNHHNDHHHNDHRHHHNEHHHYDREDSHHQNDYNASPHNALKVMGRAIVP